jgi:hypothetical protein
MLSGPVPINRVATCRACKQIIDKNSIVMVREGRKLRFFYHQKCFTGDADPRTQTGSSYAKKREYHEMSAPKISCLEGPRAVRDVDGRPLGRSIFKAEAPSTLGYGKWNVKQRGYMPKHGLDKSQAKNSKS